MQNSSQINGVGVAKPGFRPSQGSVLKAPLPAAGAWHLVAATYDGSFSRIYVDGKLAASQTATGFLPSSPDGLGVGFRPAAQGKPKNGMKGWVDEFRISRIAHTADFLKLSYANQRAQQTLVLRPRLAACNAVFGVPADTTVAEGSSLVLRGKAECADAWSWIPISGPAPRILDPEVEELAIAVPRITHDTVLAYRFTARFGDSAASRDVAVRIREAIPDPQFTLGPIPKWNGKDPLELRPVILNLAAIKAGPDTVIGYAWTLSGPQVDTALANGALNLKHASEAGILTVGLCLDNGGAPICRSFDMAVDPGTGVALVDPRKQAGQEKPRSIPRNALGRALGQSAGRGRLFER